jgi:DNA topoisomerase-6 subunit B
MSRTVFTTSRLLEFCTTGELSKQVGFGCEDWLFVALKELVDNGLDAAEEGGIAPEITITVTTACNTLTLTVTDNGPGIAPGVVARIIDFHTKTSSREAYVAPTRGQQGNALQTVLATTSRTWSRPKSRRTRRAD